MPTFELEFGTVEVSVVAGIPGPPGSGGGAVDSVNGQTGTVVLTASDVGADATGTAAGLVDDLSGVTDASTARTNLGLGSLATKSAVASADITDGTIVNADINAAAAIALSKLATDPLARANHTGTQAESTVTNLVSDLAAKAPLASPALTGTPTVPTAAQGTNTTQAASTAYVQTEVGLLVPKSLVTTKGDIIAASAASTPVRVAVGSNGQVLTADSTQSAGVKWATASGGTPPMPSMGSMVYIAPDVVGAFTSNPLSSNRANSAAVALGQALWVPGDGVTAIGLTFSVNVAADSGSVVYLALYAADGAHGAPSTLIKDAGSAAVDTTGQKELTFTGIPLSGGWYWTFISGAGIIGTTNPTFYGTFTNARYRMIDPAAGNNVRANPSIYAASWTTAPNPISCLGNAYPVDVHLKTTG